MTEMMTFSLSCNTSVNAAPVAVQKMRSVTPVDRCEDFGDMALWRAVILQAIIDACSDSRRTEDKLERDKARNWLKGDCAGFERASYLAGWTPEYVRKHAAKAIENPQLWRRVAPNKLNKA